MIFGFEGKHYKREDEGVGNVEERFLRGDMIQVFKIFKSVDNIETNKFFIVDHGRETRGHNKKIRKRQCHLDIRKHSFSNRVVNFWNGLPQEVVSSDSLATFKKRLDRHMDCLDEPYGAVWIRVSFFFIWDSLDRPRWLIAVN